VAPVHSTSIHWIIRFRAMLESYHKLQQKLKRVPEFKNAFQLTWFALLEKVIDKAVKD